MPDMRDALKRIAHKAINFRLAEDTVASVIDSIPPGSFKLDEKTWVRLRFSDGICLDEEASRG